MTEHLRHNEAKQSGQSEYATLLEVSVNLRKDVAFLARVTRQLRDIAIAAHINSSKAG